MKTETKQAIDRLNQVIDDYINIFLLAFLFFIIPPLQNIFF